MSNRKSVSHQYIRREKGHSSTYDWNERETSVTAKELIHDDVIRSSPCGKGKHREELGNISREPIPGEGPGEDVQEESVAADGPSIGPGRICLGVIMESVPRAG